MALDEPAPPTAARDRPLGLTVYDCDPDEAELFHELAPRAGLAVTTTGDAVSDASVVRVPRNRCASVGHRSELSARELHALRASGVEHVITRSIGLDHIDLDAAAASGVTVENVVYSPDGVADFTVMLILMSLRDATGVAGRSERHPVGTTHVRGRDLRDLTVGVVGVGNIGRAVVDRLEGFGCRVLACSNAPTAVAGAQVVDLDELLGSSDVVSLHVPLASDTHHLIGRAQFEAMRPGALLVNTARGALVDTDALIDALESGHLGAAALDVLEDQQERVRSDRGDCPPDQDHLSRLRFPQVLLTPHVAYRTTRALYETVDMTLTRCVLHERNRTNAEAHDRDPVRRLLGGA